MSDITTPAIEPVTFAALAAAVGATSLVAEVLSAPPEYASTRPHHPRTGDPNHNDR